MSNALPAPATELPECLSCGGDAQPNGDDCLACSECKKCHGEGWYFAPTYLKRLYSDVEEVRCDCGAVDSSKAVA